MSLPKIGAIVVNYNNPRDTRETLASLFKFVGDKKFRLVIYLVNNGCTDTESPLLKTEFPKITLINSSRNLGFAGGNNLGFRKGHADGCTHFLLINNDAAIISQDFFSRMLQSPYDLTAPLIEYRQTGRLVHDYGGRVDYLFGRNTHQSGPGRADYFSGACLFFKVDILKKIKGLNDAFFLYYEDVDFCLRARQSGFTLGLLPDIKVFHHLSASTNKLGSQKIKILAKSHLIFCRRHLPVLSFPFYFGFNLFLQSKIVWGYLDFQKSRLNEFLYPYLNYWYCLIHHTPQLHLIGDSHVWSYTFHHPFVIHHLGAATAYNLSNPKSGTGSLKKLQELLPKINRRRSMLIFEFGEIDCRLHIYNFYRQNQRRISLEQIISKTISRYLSVIEETRSLGFRVAILSPTPTGVEENIYQKEFFANFKQRSLITSNFHEMLKREAQKMGIVYLDLYSIVSAKDGGIKKKFRQDEVHLNSLVVPITLRLLKKEWALDYNNLA